jgi:glycerol transport system ATP-binding protein|tara:strand:- start:2087 stop:3154 length:1068 start_codon:yes stop_codon:yes gene_type:complete
MSLELKNVEKKIGLETHIYPTNLELKKNTINILLGSTLAGKTTLMQIMAGLDKPTSGEIWFDGKNVTGVAVQKRNVSMVYQQFINYPNFTVYDNIASPLKITGIKSNEIKEKVGQVSKLLKLSDMLNKKPNELSGGQQQRTALARALVKDSGLILLDEPLANLDFKLREELREELPKLFENRDCIVVYATTEPLDALLIGGNTATLMEGKIVQYGKTIDVYNKPQNLTSAEVFSDPPINISEIKKNGDIFSLLNEKVKWETKSVNLQDGNYKVGIRPHNITTYKEGNNSIEIRGKVLISEISGSESLIHFTNANLNWVSLSNGIHQMDVGQEAKLYMNVDEFIYFDQNNNLVNNV